jgi:hypothetical protein
MNEQKIIQYFEGIKMAIGSQRANFKKTIERYFIDLSFRLRNFNAAKKRMDVYLSSDFNVFKLINPDENKLSDIISDLLDSSGTHGQGDLFLREFFSEANIRNKYNPNYKVLREDTTAYITHANRRIDITLDMGKWGVGIENKPWASDQKDQVKDYQEHLDKKYSGNFTLVYMTGDGSGPDIDDEELKDRLLNQEKLIIFPYPGKVINWLICCQKECESDKYRWFLKDLIEYIDTKFSYSKS